MKTIYIPTQVSKEMPDVDVPEIWVRSDGTAYTDFIDKELLEPNKLVWLKQVPQSEFLREHLEACLRMAADSAIAKFGNTEDEIYVDKDSITSVIDQYLNSLK